MTATAPIAALRPRRLWRWRPSEQGVAIALVVLFCGGLVAYLAAESLNTGDPGIFPPESIGPKAQVVAPLVLLRAARRYSGELP
jgi:hypothetical protein